MATLTKPVDEATQPGRESVVPNGPPASPESVHRVVLRGVSFATYSALRDDLDRVGDRARLTFDRGTLEIMSPLYRHDFGARCLLFIVEAVAKGLDLDFEAAGTTTFRREDLERGLEPDECFYTVNEPRIRGRETIDLADDPPPDLVIEVDLSHSSVDKLAIYAALGVPEIWRMEGSSVEILGLDAGRAYQPIEASRSFSFLTRPDIEDWVRRRKETRLKVWLRELDDWVRDALAPRFRNQPGR
jgi:Uma2 family endonuclease